MVATEAETATATRPPSLTANEIAVLTGIAAARVRKLCDPVEGIAKGDVSIAGRRCRAYEPVAVRYVFLRSLGEIEALMGRDTAWDSCVDAVRELDAASDLWPLGRMLRLDVSGERERLDEIERRVRVYLGSRDRWIRRDPGIFNGEPIVAGTRVPVAVIAGRLEAGESPDDLAEDYPTIPPEVVEVATLFARAFPRRGRPPRPWARTA
ncbi:MAG: DUF433 domain-containing protein [Azospirillaceae bacterium]